MISKFLAVIVATILSSIFYRLGGSKDFDTKYRDVGCAFITCALAGYLLAFHWTLIICFGLLWGALSTYWKRTPNAKWYNWLMTGIGYSLAMLPYVIAEGLWIGFISRTIVLGVTTMIWSEINSNPVWEESGRGALIILTLPLLMVG